MVGNGHGRRLSLAGVPMILLGCLSSSGNALRPRPSLGRQSSLSTPVVGKAYASQRFRDARGERRRPRRVSVMSSDSPSPRRNFVKDGMNFFFGTAAATAAASSASANDEDIELSDEEKQRIMDALVKALTGVDTTIEGDEERGDGQGRNSGTKLLAERPKNVLNGSVDELPNRTPFEMQYEMFKRGMEFEDVNDYASAEKQWTEIIENFNSPNFRASSPGNKFLLARAYSNRGNTRLSLQKTREAILDYSESIDLVPEKGEFWLARGVAYEDMADRKVLAHERNVAVARTFYESALADYDHALVLDPQDPKVYISRGDANTLLGQPKEALDNYRHAVSLSPMVPEFRSKVALAELEIGNRERGAYMISQLLQRYPRYSEMLLAGAAVAWEQGDLVESQTMYNEAIRSDPRLLDDDFIWLILRWPEQPLSVVKSIRAAAKAPKGSGLDALGLPSLLDMPREVI